MAAAPRSTAAAAAAASVANALSNTLAELLKSILLREFGHGEAAAAAAGDQLKAAAYMEVQTELTRRSTSELKDIFTNMSPLISGQEKTQLLNKVMEEYKRKEAIVKAQYQTAQVQAQQQAQANSASGPPPLKKQRLHDGDADNSRATQNGDEADELKTDVTDISGINLNDEQATMIPSMRSAAFDAPLTPSPLATFSKYNAEKKIMSVLRQNGIEMKEVGVTDIILQAAYERMVNLLNQAMDISRQRVLSMQPQEGGDAVSSYLKPFLQSVRDQDERRWKSEEERRANAAAGETVSHTIKEAESMRDTAMRLLGASTRRARPGPAEMSSVAAKSAGAAATPESFGHPAPSTSQQRKISRKDMLLLMERDPMLRSSRNTHEIFLGIPPRKILEEPINVTRQDTGDVVAVPMLRQFV